MIPSKILAPILASVAFVAGAAVALPAMVAGDEPTPRREPLVLDAARPSAEPQPTLRPKDRPGGTSDGRPGSGPTTSPGAGGGGETDGEEDEEDRDDLSESDDDDDDVEVIRPQLDDDDDDEADDDDDDGDDD